VQLRLMCSGGAEHRRRAGQFPVRSDDLVELRAIEKVVVDGIGDFRAEIKLVRKSIVEAAPRTIVPEDSVTVAR